MSLENYVAKKKSGFKHLLKEIALHKTCYLFLAPYAIIFGLFVVAPVVVSIFYSFTYYNILETPKFIGLRNYINLLLGDDVFLTAVKNTFIMAAITGPIGYLASFLFAWLIHELPRYVRAVVTLIFYAPSISGAVYVIWAIIFSGDAYGYINGFLMQIGVLDEPVLWLTDPNYMMPVILIVILWMSLGTGFLAFIAGLSTIDETLYEAGLMDGIKNRWQELWFITLPNMKGMLMFGAVMAITASFGVADVTSALAGFPSTDYAVHTVVNHLVDYGSIRFEMGYASAIATLLFLTMILCNKFIQKMLARVGT
jgi:multiple sugar transport system permease protein